MRGLFKLDSVVNLDSSQYHGGRVVGWVVEMGVGGVAIGPQKLFGAVTLGQGKYRLVELMSLVKKGVSREKLLALPGLFIPSSAPQPEQTVDLDAAQRRE